jgi:hypothetical protein
MDAPEQSHSTVHIAEPRRVAKEPLPEKTSLDTLLRQSGGGFAIDGGKKEDPAEELPAPATVVIPQEAAEVDTIFVLNGILMRETASLASLSQATARSMKDCRCIRLFHLVSRDRQVLVETNEQLQQISSALDSEGNAKSNLELEGQAATIPNGAALVGQDGKDALDALPTAAQLPAVLTWRTRIPSLGLVIRLRERYGCDVSEILASVLSLLLARESK